MNDIYDSNKITYYDKNKDIFDICRTQKYNNNATSMRKLYLFCKKNNFTD
jgi:hypothetical protein